jgi:hypothetical protein
MLVLALPQRTMATHHGTEQRLGSDLRVRGQTLDELDRASTVQRITDSVVARPSRLETAIRQSEGRNDITVWVGCDSLFARFQLHGRCVRSDGTYTKLVGPSFVI